MVTGGGTNDMASDLVQTVLYMFPLSYRRQLFELQQPGKCIINSE